MMRLKAMGISPEPSQKSDLIVSRIQIEQAFREGALIRKKRGHFLHRSRESGRPRDVAIPTHSAPISQSQRSQMLMSHQKFFDGWKIR